MTAKTQVVIIGAGPTGLSMAAQLLRYDIDFIILEKNEKTTPLSKAVVVQARSLEIFRELGLADKALREGQVTTALNLFYKGKQLTGINLSGLGEGSSVFPYALSLEQSKTEKLLADHLQANGKTISWSSTLDRFEQNGEGVKVFYRGNDGKEHVIEAEYLVGCDGAGSLVRHELGLTFNGDTEAKIFYVADVELSSPVINRNELFIFLIKKGFVLFFPMEGKKHYRIVGILPGATDPDKHYQFSDVESSIRESIGVTVKFDELRWFSSYKVHSRKANSFATGRCFIAGDAAHIHTPAGGQGMNTGIQDAYNLAWKIAYTIRYKAAPLVLQSYASEREENARHLLQTTDRMFALMAGTNQVMNFIRLNFFPVLARLITKSATVKKRIFPLISQTGITYHHSELVLRSRIGKVEAGVRMPHVVLPDGTAIIDQLAYPGFKLLYFGSDADHTSRLQEEVIRPQFLSFTQVPEQLFGKESGFYILLRPDNHIAYIGKDPGACSMLLKKVVQA